jgi:ribosomal protein S18
MGSKTINKRIAYKTLNKYFKINKETFDKLDYYNIEMLLNFVSNKLSK